MISFLDFQVTTSGDEYGIHWATFRYFLKRMTSFHSVSFVCAFTHVFSEVFANPPWLLRFLVLLVNSIRPLRRLRLTLDRRDRFFEASDIGKSSEDLTAAVIRNW